jgi:putative DNA primase/helicase
MGEYMSDFIEEFRKAMLDAGLVPPKKLSTGGKGLKRFDPKTGAATGSAWYKLHADFPQCGVFGDWATGLKQKWRTGEANTMTPKDLEAFRIEVEIRQRQIESELERSREAAKARAKKLWDEALAAPDSHPYLAKKHIKPHHARVAADRSLLIPLVDASGEIISVQTIAPNGDKRFLKDSTYVGGSTSIGRLTDTIYICEGFATAATVHECSGCYTVVAFNAGNLMAVAKQVRAAHPSADIVICADNDYRTQLSDGRRNPGLSLGSDAAAAIGARVVFPEFPRGHEGTDFNDLRDPEIVVASLRSPRLPDDNVIQSIVKPLAETSLTYREEPSLIMQEALPDLSSSAKPLATMRNLVEILSRLGVTVRYNVVKKEEEILIPDEAYIIDNRANASIGWILDWCARFQMATDKVNVYLSTIAARNPHNPAAAWITSAAWDGVSRLQAFYDTILDAPNTDKQLKHTLLRRWLVSAVAAVCSPNGISAHGVLVFQGEQYIGKTAWFKRLVPQELGLTADGMILKPDDKDSVGQAVSFWLVELGELDATFRKSDIAQLKAFITKDKDIFRKPYMPKPSEFSRRTVFFASVNDEAFLQDPTGNRRFWTIKCSGLRYDHEIDMQQLWAEVKTLYDAGEPWVLNAVEMQRLNASNEAFQIVDPIEEKIRQAFDWERLDQSSNYLSLTELLHCVGVGSPDRQALNRAGAVVRKLNGSRKKTRRGVDLWLVPDDAVSLKMGHF